MRWLSFYLFIGLFCCCLTPSSEVNAQSDDTVYSLAETQPVFPGGMLAFFSFVDQELNYPKEAIANTIQGMIFLEFIVEKNGEISNIKVLKGINPVCNLEAIRILTKMPKWTPGEKNGSFVRVKMALPIHFKLPKTTLGNK